MSMRPTVKKFRVADVTVEVLGHAWERACKDIAERLPGAVTKRGKRETTKSNEELTFHDVWNTHAYWHTWIEYEGKRYNPADLFSAEGYFTKTYLLTEFNSIVSRLIDKRIERSLIYHCNLLALNSEDIPFRDLDCTETKPWADVIMVPLLDKYGEIPPCDLKEGGIYAPSNISSNVVLAAYPIDGIIGINPFVRELVSPEYVCDAFGYELDEEERITMRKQRDYIKSQSNVSLVKDGTPVTRFSVAVHTRPPRKGSVYNAHIARISATESNAVKFTCKTPSGQPSHIILVSVKDISKGEEIVSSCDESLEKMINELTDDPVENTDIVDAMTLTNIPAILAGLEEETEVT